MRPTPYEGLVTLSEKFKEENYFWQSRVILYATATSPALHKAVKALG